VGQRLARAKARIRGRHCRIGTITKVQSSLAKRGRVVSQRPKAGRTLRRGAKVNLRVGRG